jgi:hypothetical protein
MVYLKQIHGNAFRELKFLNNKMRFQICAVLVVQLTTCFCSIVQLKVLYSSINTRIFYTATLCEEYSCFVSNSPSTVLEFRL